MKMNILCSSLLVGILSLISLAKSSSSSISLIGIPPQDEDYFRTETIKCKNGSKRFPRAQLNDDFCDCPDGSDEPGTSACPQGKFYCRNIGHLPISLPSSRVNDGICDCCDGSDEYDGKVKCPKTCLEAGKVAGDKLQKQIEMYREGIVLRKKEIEQAKQAAANDEGEFWRLKNEKKPLKRLVKQLREYKEQIEKMEEKEKEEKKKVSEDKNEAGDEYDDDPVQNSSAVDDKIGPSNESSPDKDEYQNLEESPNDKSGSSDISREELGRLVASRWTGSKNGNQDDDAGSENNHGGSSETSKSTNDEVYDDSNDKKSSIHDGHDSSNSVHESNLEEQNHLSGLTTLSSTSWLERIKYTVQNIFNLDNVSSSLFDELDADRIRKEYDDASTRLCDIKARISSLKEKLKHDFGSEKEFYTWYDQCFETKQDKYVYKVCPFKEATQEDDYQKTQLGEWGKFESSYRIMLFSNGLGCWNGPSRSLKVKLRCGLKTKLSEVDELSRCEYTAGMTTPVLCLEEELEEFKHKLEALQKEQPDAHDEL